MDAETQ